MPLETQKGNSGRRYAVFISYRHADNKDQGRQWATWLHQVLEGYEIPADLVGTKNKKGGLIPASLYPVFRDEEELAADAHLTPNIREALENSEFLVVLCSPRAVESRFVADEIRYFKELGKADRILPLMIDGEPNVSDDASKAKLGVKSEMECLPEPLRFGVTENEGKIDWSKRTVPIPADVRPEGKPEQGWTTGAAYREALQKNGDRGETEITKTVNEYERRLERAKLKVIAGALGVPFGVLTKRDKAMQLEKARQRSRTRRRWLAAVGMLTVVTLAGFIYASRQRQEAIRARDEARTTLSKRVFSQALRSIKENKPFDALAQLARCLSVDPNNQAALCRLATLLTYGDYCLPLFRMRHDGDVVWAQFSPDGQRIVTASKDGTARMWDGRTGRPLTEPMKHDDAVVTAQFSPDGKRIVTSSRDSSARVWDAKSGNPITSPLRDQDPASPVRVTPDGGSIENAVSNSAQFSPDGTRVVTVLGDVNARVWDARSGMLIGTPMKHSDTVASAQFSPDGKQILTTCSDKTARLWDAAAGIPLAEPMKNVSFAEFTPDGTRVVTASEISGSQSMRVWSARTGAPLPAPIQRYDQFFSWEFSRDGRRMLTTNGMIFDTETGKSLIPLKEQGDWISSARFSPDERRIVTIGYDTVRLWDAETGYLVSEIKKHPSFFSSAQFSPNGRRIVIAAGDSTVRVWDVEPGGPLSEPMRHEDSIEVALFSPDGKRILTGSDDRTARIWDAGTGKPLIKPVRHPGGVTGGIVSAEFSPNGGKILTAGELKTARTWDAVTGEPLIKPRKQRGGVLFAHFSPDAMNFLTVSREDAVQLWDTETGEPVGVRIKLEQAIRSAEFSPDGKRIVTASFDRTARVWNAETGKPLTEPMEHGDNINSAEFSPNGKRIVTASTDTTARIWDAETGKAVTEPMSHDASVNLAKFSRDGKLILTSDGSSARVWDGETGRPMVEPMKPKGGDGSARFAPDGKRIVTTTDAAQIWDPETGSALSDPIKPSAAIDSAQFSPDGKRIVTAMRDNTARIWDIAPAGKTCPDWLPRLADAIAGQHLNNRGVFEPLRKDAVDTLKEIQEQLNFASTDDDWVTWGRWLLANRSTRTISPFSEVMVPEYIENRIKENTPESLNEAEQLSLGDVDTLKRIASARAALPTSSEAIP